jgi:hypothetical protein
LENWSKQSRADVVRHSGCNGDHFTSLRAIRSISLVMPLSQEHQPIDPDGLMRQGQFDQLGAIFALATNTCDR